MSYLCKAFQQILMQMIKPRGNFREERGVGRETHIDRQKVAGKRIVNLSRWLHIDLVTQSINPLPQIHIHSNGNINDKNHNNNNNDFTYDDNDILLLFSWGCSQFPIFSQVYEPYVRGKGVKDKCTLFKMRKRSIGFWYAL